MEMYAATLRELYRIQQEDQDIHRNMVIMSQMMMVEHEGMLQKYNFALEMVSSGGELYLNGGICIFIGIFAATYPFLQELREQAACYKEKMGELYHIHHPGYATQTPLVRLLARVQLLARRNYDRRLELLVHLARLLARNGPMTGKVFVLHLGCVHSCPYLYCSQRGPVVAHICAYMAVGSHQQILFISV